MRDQAVRAEIVMPDLGSAEAVLSLWYARPGDKVEDGDRLVEILIGAATFDIPAPCSGRLVEQCAGPDEVVIPGQVLGFIEAAAD